MRLRVLLIIFILALIILGVSILRRTNKISLPCLNNRCSLGGECVNLNNKKLCLYFRSPDDLCENYCKGKKCNIGIDKPLTINCL